MPAPEPVAIQTGSVVVDRSTSTPAIPVDRFREAVPKDVKVPEMNEKLDTAQQKIVAVPTLVTPSAPGATTNFRSFDISGEGGKFVPEQIIARVGDVVHVNFVAVDKAYDIFFPSYGMHLSAQQGQKKVMEFQAVSKGSFIYYCDTCGGLNTETRGKFIVAD